MLRFLGFLFTAGFIVFIGVAIGAGYIIWETTKTLPEHEQLARYEPPVMTRIHAGDGTLLAEYAKERRLFVPVNAIPKQLINAFVSAEDKNFYKHAGVDWEAVARAAFVDAKIIFERYVRGKRGGNLIGASTITQQVAKNFLLSSDRTIDRKLKEALVAQRMENDLFQEPDHGTLSERDLFRRGLLWGCWCIIDLFRQVAHRIELA